MTLKIFENFTPHSFCVLRATATGLHLTDCLLNAEWIHMYFMLRNIKEVVKNVVRQLTPFFLNNVVSSTIYKQT